MKCQQCSTEAPAETDPASGRLRCSKCHAFLGTGTSQAAAIRQARDILQRWSSADLMDQLASFPKAPPLADSDHSSSQSESDSDQETRAETQSNSGGNTSADQETVQTQDQSVVAEQPTTQHSDAEAPTQPHPTSSPAAPKYLSLADALPDISADNRENKSANTPVGTPDVLPSASETSPRTAADRNKSGNSSGEVSIATAQTTDADAQHPSGAEEPDVVPISAAPVATDTSLESRETSVPDRPALSLVSDTPVADSTPHSEKPAESAEAIALAANSAGTANPGESDGPKKTTRRRLRRTVVKRRPSAVPQDSASDRAPQEGMNVVKKHLRVDHPTENTSYEIAPSSSDSSTPPQATPRAQDEATGRRFRVDSAESTHQLTDGHGRVRGQGRARQRYIDEAHDGGSLRGPHFQVSAPRRSSLTSLTGQFLAYTGVLGLTIGTAIVIYGHFGGMSEYTPTGWLVTTVAQMLLFLGVINLVSGGIEQNNEDVSHRINVLGEQLLRLEQVTESAMRGPHIPPERYAGTMDAEELSREDQLAIQDPR